VDADEKQKEIRLEIDKVLEKHLVYDDVHCEEDEKQKEIRLEIDKVLEKHLIYDGVYCEEDEVELSDNDFKQIKDKVEQLYSKSVDDEEIKDLIYDELMEYVDGKNTPDICVMLGTEYVYYGCFEEYMYGETIFSYNKEIIKSFLDAWRITLKNCECTDEEINNCLFSNID
jgi:hypothetical protein